MVFIIYGHGGHLGHVTRTIWINFRSPILRSLRMKFEFNWPSGFRGEDVWKCWRKDGQRTDGRQTPVYAGVTGILIGHLGAFGSGEFIKKTIIICRIQDFEADFLFRILRLTFYSGFWGWFSIESQPQNPEFRNNPETFTHAVDSFLLLATRNGDVLPSDKLCKQFKPKSKY